MTLTPTPDDLRRVGRAVSALVSPLDHGSLDGWRDELCRATGELLGADMASCMMAVPDELTFYSPAYDRNTLASYPAWQRGVSDGVGVDVPKRQLELGVWSRATLWRHHLRAYYRSTYYDEFIVPARAFDAVGITVQGIASARPAAVLCHHERPNGRRFGGRELQLLQLLRPAFEAGVNAFETFHSWRGELFRVIDAFREAILLVEDGRGLVHRNPAATTLLNREPDRDLLTMAAAQSAASVWAGQLPSRLEPSELVACLPTRTVPGRLDSYRISASRVEQGGLRIALVSITPSSEWLPAPAVVRERLGLTAQETRVALLLAQRRTNREIAAHLSISPHTARRHTERVLAKLGVASRRDVRPILQEGRSWRH